MSTPQRVATYHKRLQEFWTAQSIVYSSSYNADREPNPWKTHEFLSSWLKNEADALFCLGVNVYH